MNMRCGLCAAFLTAYFSTVSAFQGTLQSIQGTLHGTFHGTFQGTFNGTCPCTCNGTVQGTIPPASKIIPTASKIKASPEEIINKTKGGKDVTPKDLEDLIFIAKGGLEGNCTPGRALAKNYEHKAEGDPVIVVRDMGGNVLNKQRYHGPAVMLYFDEGGALSYTDFVGVCDSNGRNKQSLNADYVGENARLYVQSGQWKYRDVSAGKVVEVSNSMWASQKPEHWTPAMQWLNAFKPGKTFVLHAYQKDIIEGPPFSQIWSMVVSRELRHELEFERSMANEWVNAMLVAIASAQRQGWKEKATELIRYAVMYGLAMTYVPPIKSEL